MNFKMIGVLSTLLFINSCTTINIKPEIKQIQHAMQSTVKIRATTINIKKSIFAVEDEEASEIQESWVGSGVVTNIDYKKNQSLILTANHVATGEKKSLRIEDDGIYILILKEIKLTVETLDGKVCESSLVAGDIQNDIAFISAKCIAGKPAEISENKIEVGQTAIVCGSPRGFHPKNIFVVVEGYYLGRTNETEKDIFSIPTAHGMSGSAVFYNEKIIAIVSQKLQEYENLAITANLNSIKNLHKISQVLWQSNIVLNIE